MPHSTSPPEFAASVRELMNEDVRRYRNFGAFWYFVKALLKRFYDRHAMPILGDFEDATVSARIPDSARGSAGDMIAAAIAEYRHNASFNLGGQRLTDDDGEQFVLLDPDVGI